MGQHLFILVLFFTAIFPLVFSVPRKYSLIQQGKTWGDAQAYCRAHHIDLAIIESEDDMVRLQNEIQTQQFSSGAWIGLYREHTDWFWSMGNEPLGSLRPWAENQPDNWNAIEWCGSIRQTGWNDGECDYLHPVVCFDDTQTGDQRYVYISDTMTWYEAQGYCRNHYTDLASVNTATENSVITGLLSWEAWFGLTRESWKWINQTSFSTITWMSGEPDITSGDETCGSLDNGQATDALCSDIMPFFCFSEIMERQQIMRMAVRSDKDVNDPAVMVVIMEQVKQKLKESGQAENITVKWRVQPDGKVFHKK